MLSDNTRESIQIFLLTALFGLLGEATGALLLLSAAEANGLEGILPGLFGMFLLFTSGMTALVIAGKSFEKRKKKGLEPHATIYSILLFLVLVVIPYLVFS